MLNYIADWFKIRYLGYGSVNFKNEFCLLIRAQLLEYMFLGLPTVEKLHNIAFRVKRISSIVSAVTHNILVFPFRQLISHPK